jgi:hypothetical protein
MAVQRDRSLAEVLDRVLDKGIVIDGWLKVSVVGVDLIGVEGRVVVASLSTYVKRSRTVDRVLGRTRRPTTAAEGEARAALDARTRGITPQPRMGTEGTVETCPQCERRGRRHDLILVTVQTSTETRLTARCSSCRWQRTYAV